MEYLDIADKRFEIMENYGHYKILKMIDYGSFGDIFMIMKASDNSICALKQIRFKGNFQDDPYVISELYCLTNLKHINIIRMHEIIICSSEIHIVMEYAENENLERYLKYNETLEFHEKFKIYLQLLHGVEYCHSLDIAHRDLTPVNVLLTKNVVVKIADFGLSVKCSSDDGVPRLCTDFLGHTAFMPPEVLCKKPFFPKPADVWTLGVTLLFLLFRTTPFKGFAKDVLESQIRETWKQFIRQQCARTNSSKNLNNDIVNVLGSSLELEPSSRSTLCELVRKFSRISLNSEFETVQ